MAGEPSLDCHGKARPEPLRLGERQGCGPLLAEPGRGFGSGSGGSAEVGGDPPLRPRPHVGRLSARGSGISAGGHCAVWPGRRPPEGRDRVLGTWRGA